MVGEGLKHENNAVVWWPTRKDGPKTKETSWPTRKLAGGEKSGLQGEELVSHPCTIFQTRKTSQTENVKWSRVKARDRRLQKSKTGLQAGKVVYDHKEVVY
ncbi:hypothetical protein CsSME_00008430 [Camellia sinensis var. sinensis]